MVPGGAVDSRVPALATVDRGLLLFGAVVVPSFGLVYPVIAPQEVDPFAARAAISVACLFAVAASLRWSWVEERLSGILLGMSFVIDAHMIGLAAINGFSGDRVVAILVTFFCVVLCFRSAGETVAFGVFTGVLTAIGYRAAPEPEITQVVLQGSFLSITAVIAVATEMRRRTGTQLDRSHRELEDRVAQRTQELGRSMEQLEREIVVRKRAEADATAASLAKSAFLANMSHELRTPLNAILGYTEMWLEEAEALALPSLGEDLGRVRKAANHLLSMIGHILDLAAIEAGKLRLKTDRVALSPFLADVCDTARPLTDAGRNTLSVDCPADLVVVTDPQRLRQILLNLLSNAAKFTDDGQISLAARAEGGRVWVSVRDTGIGIAPGVLPTLFEEFTQVDGTSTRRFGGTGLGLAISRRLGRALGGDVGVRSAVGEGTTFTVDLPQGGP